MERLWAPWRKAYIRPKGKARKGCVFCGLLKAKSDERHYILARSAKSFAVLNLYPYNNGHTLILPLRHVASLDDLTSEEKLDWLDLCGRVQQAMEKKLRPHGYNLGINLGRAAGAGIPKHLHLHVIPRWKGDSNFMPTVAGVKVISESLRSVYRELVPALPSRGKKKAGRKRR
ncbi:MAG TPA: HIT domain-containing protein [Verrucomicrobiae bacterium]|jgi:ATP adenylyltransferase|nr:HIT domain-containing protein [Verrucomicrobiae bacterium]